MGPGGSVPTVFRMNTKMEIVFVVYPHHAHGNLTGRDVVYITPRACPSVVLSV